MKFDKQDAGASALAPLPLGAIARQEWRWWVPGAVLCFLLASLMVSGWPQGLIPNLAAPFGYSGDVLSHSWMIKRVTEGWVLNSAHSGFPFGSAFHDYPGSDGGSLLLFKLIGWFNSDWQAIFNLYFLGGFAASFISAYLALRAARVERPLTVAGAVLFAFLPFHMFRMGHLFYTWYFVAPLFFHCALRIADGTLFNGGARARLLTAAGLFAMACFGVYFALFGVLVLATVGLVCLGLGERRAFKAAVAASCLVVLGVLVNVAPSLLYKWEHGPNPEVASRPASDSETYGLKLTQMVMPRAGHRSPTLNRISDYYMANMPLVNENYTAALGMAGAAGFLGMLVVALSTLAGRRHARALQLTALLVLMLFLFGTIGGAGALFSLTVSTSIRGWNRISVFIGFGALMGLAMLLQAWLLRLLGQGKRYAAAVAAVAALLAGVGLWDQAGGSPCMACQAQIAQQMQQDKAFGAAIEAALPPGAAVYQLPYMAFPEVPPQFKLGPYDLMKGYLHTRQLHWSYAGMKGREGDLFYRSLAQKPMARQLEAIRTLGFSGVYVDRGGYGDNGDAVVASLSALAGPPALTRADGQVLFFRLPPGPPAPPLAGLSAQQMIAAVYGQVSTPALLAAGVAFAASEYPDFVADVRGLSGAEAWGRWSDASLQPTVQIELLQPLPKRSTVVLTLQPFGPNAGQEMEVRVGAQRTRVLLQAGEHTYRVPLEASASGASRIELRPPQPVTPRALGTGADDRLLGIGLIKLSIES